MTGDVKKDDKIKDPKVKKRKHKMLDKQKSKLAKGLPTLVKKKSSPSENELNPTQSEGNVLKNRKSEQFLPEIPNYPPTPSLLRPVPLPIAANEKAISKKTKSSVIVEQKNKNKTPIFPTHSEKLKMIKEKKATSFSGPNLYDIMDDTSAYEKYLARISPVDTMDKQLMKTQSSSDKQLNIKKSKSRLGVERSVLETPICVPPLKANGTTIHPLSYEKIDVDLVGRVGMYLERHNLKKERRKAFDWIAYNRHDFVSNRSELSDNLGIALSDIGISKKQFTEALETLKLLGQISEEEMKVIVKKVGKLKHTFLTISTACWLLKDNCSNYRKIEG